MTFTPHPRLKPSKAARRYIVDRQGGVCAACAKSLTPSEAQIDHVIPLAIGGGNDWLEALCAPCHKAKTAIDLSRIAKAKRQARYHATGKGRARKGRPLKSAGFPKHITRRMDGTVARRDA